MKNLLLKKLFSSAIAIANHMVPKRRGIVLHSFPDVEDQLVAFLRWMAEHRNISVTLIVARSKTAARDRLLQLVGEYAYRIKIVQKSRFEGVWAYLRADTILITHGLYHGFVRKPKRQTVINLWHGMPIKAIWKASKNAAATALTECDYMLSTSPKYCEILSNISGVPRDRVLPIGLPRNDSLLRAGRMSEVFTREVRREVDRVVLFLPTFRQSNLRNEIVDGTETADALMMSATERRSLLALLRRTGTRMLVKAHPMSMHYGKVDTSNANLWFISDDWLHERGVTLYDALGEMNLLITDISSVYVDCLVRDLPTVIYFPDYVEYSRTRGFVFDPVEDWLPGRLCTTVAQLLDEVDRVFRGEDNYGQRRAQLAAVLNPQREPVAVQNLCEFIDRLWREPLSR